jgi:hypothetical protein
MSTSETTSGAAPPISIAGRLRETLGIELGEIAGTTISGEIPIAASALNRLIAERLAASETPVVSATLEPHDGNRLTAYVKLRARFVPPLKIDAIVERQPELPDRPVIGLRWSIPSLGPLAAFAAPALTLFQNSLPRGIRAQGDWLEVDLRELLRARGLDELMRVLVGLELTTREGRVVIQFHVRS